MSIYDNVAYGLRAHGKGIDLSWMSGGKSLREASLWEEVKDRLKSSALKLSGAAAAFSDCRVLAVQPEVLLMDEQASALDPISTAKLEDLVNR